MIHRNVVQMPLQVGLTGEAEATVIAPKLLGFLMDLPGVVPDPGPRRESLVTETARYSCTLSVGTLVLGAAACRHEGVATVQTFELSIDGFVSSDSEVLD